MHALMRKVKSQSRK